MAVPLSDYFIQLSHGPVPKKDAMKYETIRLSTFKSFPESVPQSSLRLASAGFFFTGQNDEVECFDCGLKLKDWGVDDNPLLVHKKYSSGCSFISNNSLDNIPSVWKEQKQTSNATAVGPLADHLGKLSTNLSVELQPQYPVTIQSDCMADSKHQDLRYSSRTSGSKITARNFAHIEYQGTNNVAPAVESNNPFNEPRDSSYIDYKLEHARLTSFINWPTNTGILPEDLAKDGFYYMGSEDRVQCIFCRGILRNWEPTDVPESEHRRHFGQCPFLSSPSGVGNVPLSDEQRTGATGNKNDLMQQNHCYGIITDKPVHPQYSLPTERLATFNDFPTNMTQTPTAFANAGFFYSGMTDSVKCFFCDGGLCNWEPNDDPWAEHARWFPRCGFLRLCKGDEFIKDIQSQYTPPTMNQNKGRKVKHNPAPKKAVDPKAVEKAMKHKIVEAVQSMGYETGKIRQVIIRRMEELGNNFFPNAESLLDAILEYEEDHRYTEVCPEDTLQEGNNANDSLPPKEEPKKKNKKKKNKKKKNVSENTVSTVQNVDENEAKQLTDDIQKMKDERMCKICMDEDVNIVFLRCGHLVCCSNCAPALRHCPICRELIRGTVRVFLS